MKTANELIEQVYQIQVEHEKEPASEQQSKVCFMLDALTRDLREMADFDEDMRTSLTQSDHALIDRALAKIRLFPIVERVRETVDTVDLMRDEFMRINALTQTSADWHNASEVQGICERAVSKINQTVPLIVQRDRLENELSELKTACEYLIDAGRPHGRNDTYPDGCECEACESFDRLKRILSEIKTPCATP